MNKNDVNKQIDALRIKSQWCNEIAQYDKDANPWQERSKKISDRYIDKRMSRDTASRYNILWSNIQTLKPALFSQNPHPEVERRFKDEDPAGRLASEVLERCLSYSINCETQEFNEKISQVVLDRLLPGRGMAWVRYVPHFQDMAVDGAQAVMDGGAQTTDDSTIEGAPQEVSYEEVVIDYIHCNDFGHTKARTWEEVSAVWRKTYLSKDDLAKRFPDVQDIPLDHGIDDKKTPESNVEKKATVYEIWDRKTKKVYWIHKSVPRPLDIRDDPLRLEGFFPCPRPLFATLSNNSVIPTPDYVLYQDQADELDNLTGRIDSITKSIKVAGVYASTAAGISRLLSEGVDNELIPVDDWAAFAELGGLPGVFSLLPMEQILNTLIGLYESRERVKQDLYEITGMADIIRGANDPGSTATAERIKSNFASIRLRDMQSDVARFVRDLVRIMGEIIAGHFGVDTLKKISGQKLLTNEEKASLQQMQQMQMQVPQDQLDLIEEPSWEEVDALLKDNSSRAFRIDIETDSTIKMDEEQAQASRMEFLEIIGGFLDKSVTAVKEFPQMAPIVAAALMFAVRSFKAGRQLEAQFQKTADKLIEMSEQAENQPPSDPEATKANSAMQLEQSKAQTTIQVEQMKSQFAAQQADMQHQLEMHRIEMEAQLKEREQLAQLQQNQHQQSLEAQREQIQKEHEYQLEQLKEQHSFSIEQMKDATERWKAQLQSETSITVAQIGAHSAIIKQDMAGEQASEKAESAEN